MKLRKLLAQLGLAAVVLSTLNLQLSTAHAQGTTFTYQGRLDIAGAPASGSNDLTFTLFDAVTAGATVGTSNTVNDLVITNGLFTVTLDFGAGAFNGAARWLQIAARPGVSTGAYTNLAPRQPITPAPYAVFAGGAAAAGVTGTLPASALAGAYSGSVNLSNVANSFVGNGAGLTSLNASNLSSGTVADARLSTNVALRNSVNTFTAKQTITNAGNNAILRVANPNGSFTYDGFAPTAGGETLLGAFTAAGTNWPQLRFTRAAGGSFMDLGQNGNGDFVVEGNDSPRLVVQNGGNVGIGTTNPYNQLDVGAGMVIGNSTVGSGQHDALNRGNKVSFGYNIPQPGFPDEFNGMKSTVIGPLGCGNAGIVNFFTWQCGVSASREVMRIDGFGNVGIGTTTPNAKLDVNGDIQVAPGKLISSSGRLHISSQGGEPLYLNAFVGSTDVIIGGGGAAPNLQLIGGEIYAAAINLTSDRNAKEEFKPINARAVLDKVARLPITEWQYKGQDKQPSDGTRHIGPMAQDFHAAFGTGRDDKHITSVDADGVALAAIQGLHEMVKEKSAEVDALKQSVAELKELVKRLTQPAGR